MKFYIVLIVTIFSSFTLAYGQDAPNKTDAAGKKQGHWIKYDDSHKYFNILIIIVAPRTDFTSSSRT